MAYTQKRGESYRIRVSCGYDASGKQIVRSMTWTPPKGLTSRQVKRELERVAYEFETSVQNGYGSDQIKVADFADEWLKAKKTACKETTVSNYRWIINLWLLPEIGQMRVIDVRAGHIQRIVQKMIDYGVSATTIDGYIVPVSSMFSAAVKQGLIEYNPASTEKLIMPRKRPPKTDMINRDELGEIMTALKDYRTDFRVLVNTAVATGCRGGELCGLRWSDIDFERRLIHIRRTTYRLIGEDVKISDPKTVYSRRDIAVPAFLIDMLQNYRGWQSARAEELGDYWQGDGDIVFPDQRGRLRDSHSVYGEWIKFLRKNGIRHHTFHSLRHTSASYLVNSGIDIKTVGARLGHTNLSTTQKYLHVMTDADVNAAEKLDVIIQNANDTDNVQTKTDIIISNREVRETSV